MIWQKLALVSILLLATELIVFTIPCYLALIGGYDGFNVIMTSVFGLWEQILDVIVLSTTLLLGIISAVGLFKLTYWKRG